MKRRISEILSASTGVLKQVAALTAAVFVFAAAFAAPSFAASSYDNLAVANVKNEPLNMRTSPSVDAEIIGKCYRGSGGTVLDRKNGWTRIRSGGLEGWLKDDYLLFGRDIEPLAKELGLLRAKVTAVTLNVRKTPSTDAVIVKQAARGNRFRSWNPQTAGSRFSFRLTQAAISQRNTRKSYQFRELRSMQKRSGCSSFRSRGTRQNLLM